MKTKAIFSVTIATLTTAVVNGFSMSAASFPRRHQTTSALSARRNQRDAVESAATESRRQVMSAVFGGAAAAFVVGVGNAHALDMDSFMNSQLEADTKNCDPKKDPKCAPQMTEDEALCKYGQSGDARAEACKRFKAGGGTPPKPGSGGKSLGGAYAM